MIRSERRVSGGNDDTAPCPMTPEKLIELVVTQQGLVTDVAGMKTKVDAMHDKMMQGKGILFGIRFGFILAVTAVVVLVGSAFALASGKITIADIVAKIVDI